MLQLIERPVNNKETASKIFIFKWKLYVVLLINVGCWKKLE